MVCLYFQLKSISWHSTVFDIVWMIQREEHSTTEDMQIFTAAFNSSFLLITCFSVSSLPHKQTICIPHCSTRRFSVEYTSCIWKVTNSAFNESFKSAFLILQFIINFKSIDISFFGINNEATGGQIFLSYEAPRKPIGFSYRKQNE